MSTHGFYVTRLVLSGNGLEDAIVEFADGLNVVTGPSDTGKTFIAQCIDFMFGASKPPETIPEAEGYELVTMTLFARADSQIHTLARSLRGGGFTLTSPGQAEVVLSPTHDPNNDATVSHFLLALSGLAGKLVRTNKRGTTRQISFRDIARLIVVDEETIISKRSPILTGQYTTRTTERNVFRLLLTGVDDSSIQESPDQRLVRQRESGKSEVLDKVRESLLERIRALGVEGTSDLLRDQLAKVDADLQSISDDLAIEQRSATELEGARREVWNELRRIESRLAVISELQERFQLLDQQYSSDIRRLESITEAGFRLEQLQEERCPVCGALPEHHETEHHVAASSPGAVASASQAEGDRIRELKADLARALDDNEREVALLNARREGQRTSLTNAGTQLENETKPRLQEAFQRLREGQERRSLLLRILELHEQVSELDQLADEDDSSVGSDSGIPSATVGTGEAEEFSKEVEELLRDWHFPDLDRVVFSEDDQDVVITGRRRSSHGKGVRAITHAAFNIALADYCVTRTMPHPTTVIIDSPLVVYREPDDDEGSFSTEVKDMFYRTLATREVPVQTIILENDVPPIDVDEAANVIKFTGANIGRRGFIPDRVADGGSA